MQICREGCGATQVTFGFELPSKSFRIRIRSLIIRLSEPYNYFFTSCPSTTLDEGPQHLLEAQARVARHVSMKASILTFPVRSQDAVVIRDSRATD